ncbi:hypothetical protein AB2L57_05855 [Microbacterium sp. HA-8]|uniref:hypothetical protein n=1 Tax=Microbacterium sp. HA-8 TaxID=3234200 RepID=UPI0038F62D57
MVIPDDFPIDFQVGLNGLQYEDGSGQSFMLNGYLSMLLGVTKIEHKHIEFYYHAGRHQGAVGPIEG